MDFPITLDPVSPVPLWKQLFIAIRNAIVSGRLQLGSFLPPTRQLADLLSISRDTVVRAYHELISQAYIETKVGAGTFVCYNLPRENTRVQSVLDFHPTAAPPALSHYAERIQALKLSASTSGDLPQLNFGAAPAELLPAKQWREIFMHHAALQDPLQLCSDEETFGFAPLREALASYLNRSKAIRCTPEQIVVFPDSQNALDLLARILLDPGDGVVVENPGYGGARNVFTGNGATLCPVAIDEDGLITSDLHNYSGRCKMVYVSPYHHDPTGVVMSASRRQELLAWSRENSAFVVEDAFDSDYRYGSQPLMPLQAMDQTDSVIYLYSFWKTLYPITTIGCAVLPQRLLEIFGRAKLLGMRNYSLTEQQALTDLLADGYLERHIRKTKGIYARRRQALLYALAQNFSTRVSYFKESGGLHLTVRFSPDIQESHLIECASEADLPLASTRAYYVQNPTPGEFLIPFASLPEETAAAAVKRVSDLLYERYCYPKPGTFRQTLQAS